MRIGGGYDEEPYARLSINDTGGHDLLSSDSILANPSGAGRRGWRSSRRMIGLGVCVLLCVVGLVVAILVGLHKSNKPPADDTRDPIFHFHTSSGWINDPYGFIELTAADGAFPEFHFFYQRNANALLKWTAPMDWGHVSSRDTFVHWKDHGVVLSASGLAAGGCWDGRVFFNPETKRVEAMYTGVVAATLPDPPFEWVQRQLFMHATDLDNWTTQPTPVLSLPVPGGAQNLSAFRDPFVWRGATEWKMLVGSGFEQPEFANNPPQVLLYTAPFNSDLGLTNSWTFQGIFFEGSAATDGPIYECPNFFQLVANTTLYILSLGLNRGPHAFHNKVFVGNWDDASHTFSPFYSTIVDYGDFYAASGFVRSSDNQLILMGWAKELDGFEVAVTQQGWAGVLSIPRKIGWDEVLQAITVQPIPTINSLRNPDTQSTQFQQGFGTLVNTHGGGPICSKHLDLTVTFHPPLQQDQPLRVYALASSMDADAQQMVVIVQPAHSICIQHQGPAPRPATVCAPWTTLDLHSEVTLRILVDGSIVEVFANSLLVLTSRGYHFDSTSCKYFVDAPNVNGADIVSFQMTMASVNAH